MLFVCVSERSAREYRPMRGSPGAYTPRATLAGASAVAGVALPSVHMRTVVGADAATGMSLGRGVGVMSSRSRCGCTLCTVFPLTTASYANASQRRA